MRNAKLCFLDSWSWLISARVLAGNLVYLAFSFFGVTYIQHVFVGWTPFCWILYGFTNFFLAYENFSQKKIKSIAFLLK